MPVQNGRTDLADDYASATPASRTHFDRALKVMPSGVSRGVNGWEPHPIYVVSGDGPQVKDLDGRTYLDFVGNYTSLVLGHADPNVSAAITRALVTGSVHSISTPEEVEFAEQLVGCLPGLEAIRFTATGTEAMMYALRLARAYTGRTRIAKMDGGFHGTYDGVGVTVPPLMHAVDDSAPPAVADGRGLPPAVLHDALVLPFNLVDETAALIAAHAPEIAAVVVEPVLCVGGMVPADRDYLVALREACDRHGIVLVFDEVVTLRLAPGGAQELYGVLPDLTVLGKIIGGGLPMGAVGGSRRILDLTAPEAWRADAPEGACGPPAVFQRGTFHSYPAALAAGRATIDRLRRGGYEHINALGDELRRRLDTLAATYGIPWCTSGTGSLLAIHMMDRPPRTGRDMRRLDVARQHDFFLAMLLEGVLIAPRGLLSISVPMNESHVDFFTEATRRALARIS